MAKFEKFYMRRGTTDYGKDYELLITAYVALRLTKAKTVKDFSITNNDADYGRFDDLVAKVTYFDGRSQKYLFQIRYRSHDKVITMRELSAEKGVIRILDCIKSFESLEDKSDVICIIFTNNIIGKLTETYIEEHKIILREDDDKLFNSGKVFSLHTCDNWMSEFFQSFRIFSGQMSIDLAKKTVNEMLMELVQCQIFETFINFIREGQYKNFVLKKEDVVLKLAEITLSPFIRTLSSEKYNPKCESFAKIINNFDITKISGDLEDTVGTIWDLGEETKEEQKVVSKYSIAGRTQFLTNEQRSRALWYLNRVPFILKLDDWNKTRVDSILKLLHDNEVKRHFILLGPTSDYRYLKIFEKMSDIQGDLELDKFFVSVQQRPQTSLKTLLESVPELASVLTSSDLLKMTQETLQIGNRVTHLPKIYIPRKVTTPSQPTPVEEKEMLQVFTNPVNVIMGEPGTGKSTLMSSLANQCPSDYWVIYVILREYNIFFKKKPLFSEILTHFLQNEKVFFGKIYLFLDGLDEIENVDFVLDYIKYVGERDIKVWLSARLYLEATISNFLRVTPIYIQELEKEDFAQYLPLGLIPAKITFLEMSILNQLPSITIDKDLTGPEIFTKFFDWKKETFGESLDHYEITALSTCLENKTIHKLNLEESANLRFLEEIEENGDTLGIISHVDEGRAVFTNRSYAEYLTSAWIIKNLDKVKILKQELFSKQNQNLKYMFDVMLALRNPLLLGVIYQNVEKVKEHINDSQETEMRTPLHVLCSQRQVNEDILKILLDKYDIFEKDQLFFWNCSDYAIRVENLQVIDKMLEKYGDSPYFDNVYKNQNIAELAAELSYPFLLEFCIKRSPATKPLLHIAAKSKNKNTARVIDILIRSGFDINMKDEKRKTALQVALEEGNYEVTKILIEKGANVKILVNQRRTLLHQAVTSKFPNIQIIELLIDKVDINARDFEGATALHLACKGINHQIVKKLVERGADFTAVTIYGKSALHFAISDLEIVDYLLSMGIDINSQDLKGVTALHLASKHGCRVIVEGLLERGADLYCVTNSGKNALHYAAASSDSADIINLLIKEGIDVDARDQDDVTSLHVAVENGHCENVTCLLDNHANINDVDKKGRSCLYKALDAKTPDLELITLLIERGIHVDEKALDLAVEKGQEDIVTLLIDNDAKINENDYKKLLHVACKNRNVEFVKFLLSKVKGETLLHYAVATCYPNVEVIRLLLDQDIDIKQRNLDGESALHIACRFNNHYNVEALLDGGVDVNALTKKNENALHFAMRLELLNNEVVKLLLKAGIDTNQQNLQGETPRRVRLACKYKYDSYMKELGDRGANIEVPDVKAAVYQGNVAMVNLFLDKIKSIDLEEDKDYPLYFAKDRAELTKLAEVVHKYRQVHGDDYPRDHLITFMKNCEGSSKEWLKKVDLKMLQFDKLCPCELHQTDQ